MIQTVTGVVKIVTGIAQIFDNSPDKEAKLQQERLNLERQRRALELASQRARLRREQRAKTAAIVNQGAAQGILRSTAVTGAVNATGQNTLRERTYLDQTASLADQADNITSQQIEQDAANQRRNNLITGINTTASGIGDIASGTSSSGQ